MGRADQRTDALTKTALGPQRTCTLGGFAPFAGPGCTCGGGRPHERNTTRRTDVRQGGACEIYGMEVSVTKTVPDLTMVDVVELWSECRVCGSAIRLLDREWHHPESASHGAEPELIPRLSGHMPELRVSDAGSAQPWPRRVPERQG